MEFLKEDLKQVAYAIGVYVVTVGSYWLFIN